MSKRMYYVCRPIKYSMSDLVCDVITCCVLSCFKTRKKRCLHKSPSRRSFRHRIHSFL